METVSPEAENAVDPALQAALFWSDLRRGQKVLEISTRGASRLAAARAGFLPIDFDLAVHWHAPGGETGWRFWSRRGGAAALAGLPEGEAPFDLVIGTGLAGLGNAASLARELARVAAPGGQLAWSESNRWAHPLAAVARGSEPSLALGTVTRALRSQAWNLGGRWALLHEPKRPNYFLPLEHREAPAEVVARTLREQFAPLNRAGWRTLLKRWAAEMAQQPWALRLAPAWHLTASRGGGRRGAFLDGSVADDLAGPFVVRLAKAALGREAEPLMLLVRQTHSIVLPTWTGESLVYLKLPLSAAGLAAHRRHVAQTAAVRQEAGDAVAAPRVVAEGEYDGQPYHAEAGLDGTGGGRIQAPLDTLLERAQATLLRLHQRTRREVDADTRARWRVRLDHVTGLEWPAALGGLAPLLETARQVMAELTCSVWSHNDFHLGNVVFAQDLSVSGVLDWDLADPEGWPLCDALHLALSVALRRRVESRARALRRIAEGEYGAERQTIERCAHELGLALDWRRLTALYAVTHLERLHHQLAFAAGNESLRESLDWQAREIVSVAVA